MEKSNKLPNRADCLVEVKKTARSHLPFLLQTCMFNNHHCLKLEMMPYDQALPDRMKYPGCALEFHVLMYHVFFLTYPLPGDLPHHTNDNSEQEKMKTCTIISVVC